ncbi:hypothetical protein COLO4_01513 [Corchorus olitorius]|uniref:Uncharacterized protein n=1 Tax=Corchorus olitorius TaxID=93759 RepID=A0A1R3L0T6_9ROSI|nr:hypothetical protein COLO4_02594 [Corchorus olitorius]OMP12971.1 hypothetical protein COLO4_02505 [Corchorus olitorius]OMP13518.1 hypothetical protein COLO4_01513 [Corchorus olitorius]
MAPAFPVGCELDAIAGSDSAANSEANKLPFIRTKLKLLS